MNHEGFFTMRPPLRHTRIFMAVYDKKVFTNENPSHLVNMLCILGFYFHSLQVVL